MAVPLLTCTDIALTFGSTPLLEAANLRIYPRERICLVGRNGSGKSTLLKIAAGFIEADAGTRFFKPGTSWRYLPQEPDLSAYDTLYDYVRSGLLGADDDFHIPYLLDALALTGKEDPKTLSGGEARRAALAKTLAPRPDILMLDEPTNHLDLPAIEWLETELRQSSAAILLISHDRRFLESLSQKTLWMDRGVTHLLDKDFSHFENWRDEKLEQEALEQHKLARQIHREQHWVVHGVSGRRKRNVKRLKDLAELRKTLKTHRSVEGQVDMRVTEGVNSGKHIANLSNISKGFDGRTLVKNLDLKIQRGERLGLIGPNGSGKTTLLKLIMGQIAPDDGSAELGVNLQPLIIDQKRESLNPDWSLSEALTDGGGDMVMVGDKSVHVMRYMKDFLFLPEQARTPLHALSGGERGRLQLARGLRLPSNLLILDEPTNDLDLETLDLLQEMIADYKGTVIIVSHDRDFLDRTVTRSLAYEGGGHWQIYAGGYSDMIAQRGRGVDARKLHGKSKAKAKTSSAQSAAALGSDNARKNTSGADQQDSDNQGEGQQGANLSNAKLSYKHKFRLEQLPKDMAALEQQIKAYEMQLSNAEFYAQDPQGFTKTSNALTAAQDTLSQYEEEWLELEILKESLEP